MIGRVVPVEAALEGGSDAEPVMVMEQPQSRRKGRTLGLLSFGAEAVGAGVGAAGSAAASAIGVAAAAKPLILLGLGKCKS